MSKVMIEFYKGKDEQAFLERWERAYGSLTEEQIDDLYADIADAIDAAVKSDRHELGDTFNYKSVTVGRSDFNDFYALYLFEAPKD